MLDIGRERPFSGSLSRDFVTRHQCQSDRCLYLLTDSRAGDGASGTKQHYQHLVSQRTRSATALCRLYNRQGGGRIDDQNHDRGTVPLQHPRQRDRTGRDPVASTR